MRARDFKASAKHALLRKWGVAILVTFIASLLGVFGEAGFSVVFKGSSSFLQADIFGDSLDSPVLRIITSAVSSLAAVSALWGLARFLVGGALLLGYSSFTLNLADGKEAKPGDLFGKFNVWGQAFLMNLLLMIYKTLWTLLFIIPGIIKSYAYAMTPYVLSEHPEMTANEAIDRSIDLMRGNKWRLFCLDFSFIGWAVLCLFTFGIGNLWLLPFREVSHAEFYREICREKEIY